MLKHRIRFIKDWHQICNHLERLQLFQIFIKLLLTILMLSPVLIEKFNIFKFASACLKLIRKAFELYKDSEMTHWLRTRFQQAEEIQAIQTWLFACFFQRLLTLLQSDAYIMDWRVFFPKERYLACLFLFKGVLV